MGEAYLGEIHENEYAHSLESLTGLTTQLLQEIPPKEDQRYVCYEVGGDSRYARIGRVVERAVFEASFGNDATQMQEEYGPYEATSRFFISIDSESKKPIGVLRAIENEDLHQLKTCHDLMRDMPERFDEARVRMAHHINTGEPAWDIGTLAVLPEYRSRAGAASVQLYRAMYNAAQRGDIKHLIAIIDQKPYRKLTKYLGVPFVKLAHSNAFSYLGSTKSQAVYGYVPEFYDTMSRRRLPIVGRKIARKAMDRLVEGSEDDAIYTLGM